MSPKETLLAMMAQVRADLEAIVLAEDADLQADAGDDWRIIDLVAHIALWERVAAQKLTGEPVSYAEGAVPEPWDLDVFNEMLRERMRSWTTAEVLAEFEASHAALVAAVQVADDEDCVPGGRVWRAIAEDSAGHYAAHFRVSTLFAQAV
jgi:hypothetical protein